MFVYVKSRRLILTRRSTNHDAAWAVEQMAAFAEAARGWPERPLMLVRDRDSKFGPGVHETLTAAGIQPLRRTPFSPNLNAYCRAIHQETLQVECLDLFIVLGTGHLDFLARECSDYYTRQRPHSRIGFGAPEQRPRSTNPKVVGKVRGQEWRRGIIRHYYRKVA